MKQTVRKASFALRKRSKDAAVQLGAALLIMLLITLHWVTDISLLDPSIYDTYTRQAIAWRTGSHHLPGDVPHLELAIFQGQYYVSFPPMPSIVLLPLTLIFGCNVPDALLMMVYAVLLYYALVRFSMRLGCSSTVSALFSLLFITGSSLLPMLLTGAVWYHAQVLALTLTVLSIERMQVRKPTIALLLYALAVGCRPFNALYGPLLMLMHIFAEHHAGKRLWERVRPMLPGIAVGLFVAFAYGWYNYARFENVFEFGHNHLPEFSFQGGQQFSLVHIRDNVRTFLFGSPFVNENGIWHLQRFGFSMLIANPALLWLVFIAVQDIVKKHISCQQVVILLVCVFHLVLLLSHRTFGGFQYGARYAIDCLPYVLLYMQHRKRKKHSSPAVLGLLAIGTLLAVWGSVTIYLPG